MKEIIEITGPSKGRSKLDDNDPVNHPAHYTQGKFEVIEVLEDWKLDFRLANAIKYIARSKYKGNAKQDLEKAVWYIHRYIDFELAQPPINSAPSQP